MWCIELLASYYFTYIYNGINTIQVAQKIIFGSLFSDPIKESGFILGKCISISLTYV